MKKIPIVLLSLLCFSISARSQDHSILFWWNFDDAKEPANKITEDNQINLSVPESAPYSKYQIGGLTKYVPGVKGSAIKFDLFSTVAFSKFL